MPLFEYICRGCDSEFEALVQSGRDAICPQCGGRQLDRKLSGFAVLNRAAVPRCKPDASCAGCCPSAGGQTCPLS